MDGNRRSDHSGNYAASARPHVLPGADLSEGPISVESVHRILRPTAGRREHAFAQALPPRGGLGNLEARFSVCSTARIAGADQQILDSELGLENADVLLVSIQNAHFGKRIPGKDPAGT